MAGVKYRGFDPRTRPLRWGIFMLLVGATAGITAPLAIQSAQAWLGPDQASLSWYGSRLLGWLAYGALAISVSYGLLLSTGILDALAHRTVSFALHQDLAAIALGLTALHGALLALDQFVPQTVGQLIVPFAGPYLPLWVGIGQLTFYLMTVTYFSFYARKRIGQRGWRLLHYSTLLAFVGATVHGWLSGSDSGAVWAVWTYAGASALVAFLLGYRLTLAAGGAIGNVSRRLAGGAD